MNPNSPLADLRDIHLPEPISWWPLAPGWWLLICLLILCIAGVFLFIWIRRRTALKRVALAELHRIRTRSQQVGDNLQTVKELSSLLRRTCISIDPRHQAASLVGNAWLQHLDSIGTGTVFSEGPGKLLTEAPYRRESEIDIDELLDLCQSWLQKLPPRREG